MLKINHGYFVQVGLCLALLAVSGCGKVSAYSFNALSEDGNHGGPGTTGNTGTTGGTGPTVTFGSPSPSPSSSPSGMPCCKPCPTPSPTASYTAAILVLDPNSPGSLTLSGNAAIAVANGSIVVDSDSKDAITLSGNAVMSASAIYVTGGYTTSGGAKINPTPMAGSKPMADPLAKLPAPSTNGLTSYSNGNVTSSTTLKPGVYPNGINISGQANVTMEPGTYIIQRDFNVSGGSSVKGSGVFIYIDCGGSINFSGGTTGSLSPPTSGTYAGITIFQMRSNSTTAQLSGEATWSLQGTLYFPSAQVQISGGSDVSNNMSLIVDQLQMSGGSDL